MGVKRLAAAAAMLTLVAGCNSGGGGGGTASAGSTATPSGSGGGGLIPSLVNVDLSNVLNDLAVRLNLDRANIPVNAQVPIQLAVNVCGVSVNILSVSTGGQANCTANNASPELAQVVQQQIAAGGNVGGGAQGGSTAGTSGTTSTSGTASSGATGTTSTSTGTTTTTGATTGATGTTQPDPNATQGTSSQTPQ